MLLKKLKKSLRRCLAPDMSYLPTAGNAGS